MYDVPVMARFTPAEVDGLFRGSPVYCAVNEYAPIQGISPEATAVLPTKFADPVKFPFK
jgi:hypothetical protein